VATYAGAAPHAGKKLVGMGGVAVDYLAEVLAYPEVRNAARNACWRGMQLSDIRLACLWEAGEHRRDAGACIGQDSNSHRRTAMRLSIFA